MKNISEAEVTRNIVELTDGKEFMAGDFLIKRHYGAQAYYKGNGGDVVFPDMLDHRVDIYFEKAKNITSLTYPGTFKTVTYPLDFGSKSTLEKLVFEEGVKAIAPAKGGNCFNDFKKMKEVDLPESLQYLGKNAFKGSPWYEANVEKVGGCHYIGKFLVDSDEGIEEADIREGTTLVCESAFQFRRNLTKVVFPSTLIMIDDCAFDRCINLKEVIIPQSVRRIGEFAFRGTWSCKTVDVPDSCDVEEYAFLYRNVLPDWHKKTPFTEEERDFFFRDEMPERIYLPYSVFLKCRDDEQKDHYAMYCLTCKDRYTEEQQNALDEYIKKRRAKILSGLIQYGHVAALEAASFAIDRKNIDGLLEEAQKQNSLSVVSYLMDWKGKNVKGDSKPKAASALEALKQTWGFKKRDDGSLEITAYKGNDTVVFVPDYIGKNPVTRVKGEAFSALYFGSDSKKEQWAENRKRITEVYFPEGILVIDFDCFDDNDALRVIHLPASLQRFDLYSYWLKKNIGNITIRAPKGTYAEQFARENGFEYIEE